MLLLIFLLPVALYLLFLAHLNRRSNATLLAGPWDFAGILFAASGFVLLGGPALLGTLTLSESWRQLWIFGQADSESLRDLRLFQARLLLFVGYFLLVSAGAAILLWRRRRFTSIYNIHSQLLEQSLSESVQQHGLHYAQIGNLLSFEPSLANTPSALPSLMQNERVTLEVEIWPAARHATLEWHPAQSLIRRTIETDLRRSLARSFVASAPIADWLRLSAYCLLTIILLGSSLLSILWILHS